MGENNFCVWNGKKGLLRRQRVQGDNMNKHSKISVILKMQAFKLVF